MAHGIDMVEGKATFALLAGTTAWHGLGNPLTLGAPIEQWVEEAGMSYDLIEAAVKFDIPANLLMPSKGSKKIDLGNITKEFPKRKVLFRSDTHAPMSVVSDSYKIVQPKEVLEFFRDLVAVGDMHLETAGALFGGTRYWAMANANMEGEVIKGDKIKGRLLLTSSCDGTLATTAKFVSERVVCNNTLRIALGEDEKKPQVRVTHGATFDPAKIKEALGLLDHGWSRFMDNIKAMSRTKVSDEAVKKFIADIMLNKSQLALLEQEQEVHKRVGEKLETIFAMYKGTGMGAAETTGTVWGALNAITEYADHRIGNKDDNKLWNSWFGYSEGLKNKAFELAQDDLMHA
jgi:phage/plasmid-like protein (TIGR03299 family)